MHNLPCTTRHALRCAGGRHAHRLRPETRRPQGVHSMRARPPCALAIVEQAIHDLASAPKQARHALLRATQGVRCKHHTLCPATVRKRPTQRKCCVLSERN